MFQISYQNQVFSEAVYNVFANLKDEMSSSLLNYELGVLYKHKIYDQDAR